MTKYVKTEAEEAEDSDKDDGAVFESSKVSEEDKEDVPKLFDNTA